MFFSDLTTKRKLEKISNFLSEVLLEYDQKIGSCYTLSTFLDANPLFLTYSLNDFCEKILKFASSGIETPQNSSFSSVESTSFLKNKENFDVRNFSLEISPVKKSTPPSLEFDLLKTFVKQYEKNKERELQELNWKVDNYKLFMDEKTERFYEMSYNKAQIDEKSYKEIKTAENIIIRKNNEKNLNIMMERRHEEERKIFIKEIHDLKLLLKEKNNELMIKERSLIEKERSLLLEEEANNMKSLVNSFKSRELNSKSKKIGEKELFLLIQGKKQPQHQASKSFSTNL